ncbi:MAG: sulfatase-modifying factor protein, partial [Bacteroidetes bacterium]
MVFVKGGTFQMGSNNGGTDEKPVHRVSLDDFYIGKYEVTQKQWRKIMGNNPSHFFGCDNCPVETVSWNDVQKFITKLNQKTGQHYRLPTEAEWEYAARGGSFESPTKYAGNNYVDKVAWYYNNSNEKTHPVGEKKPNKIGIYDISGNVWEWCSDWYSNNYYNN